MLLSAVIELGHVDGVGTGDGGSGDGGRVVHSDLSTTMAGDVVERLPQLHALAAAVRPLDDDGEDDDDEDEV